MQKSPYDAVSSQQKVLKQMSDLAPEGGRAGFFAKIDPVKATITMVHSIGHVTDRDMVCYGMDIFLWGGRRGRRFPMVYTLLKETPWQWKKYKFGNHLMELKTHYNKEDSRRNL